MRPRWSGVIGMVFACTPAGPHADVEGPRVLAVSLADARSIEIEVRPRLRIQFSEPLSRDGIGDAIALVAWDQVGDCTLVPRCDRGTCERGRCMEDPLSSTDLGRIDRGTFEDGEAVDLELLASPSGPDTLLEIVPRRPLRPHARHSLVIGAGVRDASGAPLSDGGGRAARLRRDFVTADEGSSGPEPVLVRPTLAAAAVPTNAAVIEARFRRPVIVDPGSRLGLRAEDGSRVGLAAPEPCAGWVVGFCLRWRVEGELAAGTVHTLEGGTLVDLLGRPVQPARTAQWFRVAPGPDRDPPALSELTAVVRGRCVHLRGHVREPVALTVTVRVADGAASATTARVDGVVDVALALEGAAVGEPIALEVEAADEADNRAALGFDRIAGPELDPSFPRLEITEVLQDPRGPEPRQEFVEIWVPPEAPAVAVGGLRLADRRWDDVVGAIAAGEEPPGDALPELVLAPGTVAVVVPAGHADGSGLDPDPAPGTTRIRVDASLGDGGLKNAGEPLVLYRVAPLGLVSGVETAPAPTSGISVVRLPARGCDVSASWRPSPSGVPTPGRLP